MKTLQLESQKTICNYNGIYRLYENYLTGTDWFQKLEDKMKMIIHMDFYKTIVLDIRNSLELISSVERSKKNDSKEQENRDYSND